MIKKNNYQRIKLNWWHLLQLEHFFCQLYADTKSKLCVACTDKILEYVTHQQEQSYTAIPHKIPQALTNVGYTIKERNVYSSLHLFCIMIYSMFV